MITLPIPRLDVDRLAILDRRIRRLNNLIKGRLEGTRKYYEYHRTLKRKTHERHILVWRYFTAIVQYCQSTRIGLEIDDLVAAGIVATTDRVVYGLIVDNHATLLSAFDHSPHP